MICKVCGDEFDPKHPNHANGHYGICGLCEVKTDVQRSVGLIDAVGKTDVRISVIRNPNARELAMVRRQGRCGPGMCHTSLGLGTNGGTTKKENLDKVLSKLYAEDLD